MERVKIHDERGRFRRDGRGLFAAALMDRLPLLPVEEDGRLHDMSLRENFIVRVFAHARLRDTIRRQGFGWQAIPQLHFNQKYGENHPENRGERQFSRNPLIDKMLGS